MIPNPIRKALSTIHDRKVRALLMGGQACVIYGAAELSRDTDLAVLATAANLARLGAALDDLQAERIAVPPFELHYLRKGHAVHFRCRHPDAAGLRIDVMTRMRGVAPFPSLWKRRMWVTLPEGPGVNVLSLSDLVNSKKTQRDKDWPMLRRLLEADYFGTRGNVAAARVHFWLRELRTPELLVELASSRPRPAEKLRSTRPLLGLALAGDLESLREALAREEADERARDREHWAPLRAELERLRHP